MKYSLDHLNIGQKRNLKTLNRTLAELLQKKDFEDISVTEICQYCMIPKATFYNYFEDKYDLLACFFDFARFYILGTYDPKALYDGAEAAEKMMEGIRTYREEIQKIIRCNPVGSVFYWRAANYLSEMFERILFKYPASSIPDIPDEMQARLGAQSFLTILYWAIPSDLSIETIAGYLKYSSVAK